MTISRRSLLASLGVALPAVAIAAGAQAATTGPSVPHHPKRHVHAASLHTIHHHKPAHRAAASAHVHPQA